MLSLVAEGLSLAIIPTRLFAAVAAKQQENNPSVVNGAYPPILLPLAFVPCALATLDSHGAVTGPEMLLSIWAGLGASVGGPG